ncbi:MAG: bifunctional phosphoribosylaminoimidazolecarboxamide formyltransferase/IMP cyclohydrolase [Cytophagales bacterium]|nr:bifunctional phosphoribosylaminoimidazolecarboxamide formyltransferase/IMP cyclohydrolase [Cytophagales bacterium]
MQKKITSALISVYFKDGLEPIVKLLHSLNIKIYSTGGTQKFIHDLGINVTAVEDVTAYPSIFGGRVKTLHPKVFGGILYRRQHASDIAEASQYQIPAIDLVIVDLYPFESTVASGAPEEDIIEKIDIGGVSLIRAAAKNHHDTVVISSIAQYAMLHDILKNQNGETSMAQRRTLAAMAFDTTSHYDAQIFKYFNQLEGINTFKESINATKPLRYGENPHQKGIYFGHLDQMFDVLNGKELSYNNLVDVDACVKLIDEFEPELINEGKTTFCIIKHTNACGVATADSNTKAYLKALSCDPVSAFGGVIICNTKVNKDTATELSKLFFEVLIAPDYDTDALTLLTEKKNRIILKRKPTPTVNYEYKTLLNGVIWQDKDMSMEDDKMWNVVTHKKPTKPEAKALLFANKIVKHTKSNTIVLAKPDILLTSGVGQTSRVDALKQAIEKAHAFGFDLNGCVMASDAFFPFPDCVQIAHEAGATAVLQPGGSVKDKESIDYCDAHGMSMVFTGVRHFKH